jgi:hypothetical protein
MSIFRAIGFGIFIITMRLLLPDVFAEGRSAAIAFLRGARLSADAASTLAASAARFPPPAITRPPQLPQAPLPTY